MIYSAPQCDKVIRRLTVPINKTLDGIPIRGYVTIMDALKTAFCTELAGRDARLGYIDDDGDSIVVSSDAELKVALKLVTGAAGYVRLYINPL